ncbi:MAG: hypothetical protein AAF653_07285 [Chloroflexota bacterium]
MSAWFGWVGYAAIAVALYYLALLSRRMGRVTHSRPYHIGLFVSAGIVAISPIAHIGHLVFNMNIEGSVTWGLVYNGLPALGLTIGVSFAWRYWSWLFAERD